MARIRTVKPDFWKHERLSALPEFVHMLAAALLNYADDEGYFNANDKLVKAECCPLRESSVSVHDALTELSRIDYVRLGQTADGRRFGHIVNFETHQRVNRKTPSKIKKLGIKWENSLSPHGAITEVLRQEGKGMEGKGNEEAIQEVQNLSSENGAEVIRIGEGDDPGLDGLAEPSKSPPRQGSDGSYRSKYRAGLSPIIILMTIGAFLFSSGPSVASLRTPSRLAAFNAAMSLVPCRNRLGFENETSMPLNITQPTLRLLAGSQVVTSPGAARQSIHCQPAFSNIVANDWAKFAASSVVAENSNFVPIGADAIALAIDSECSDVSRLGNSRFCNVTISDFWREEISSSTVWLAIYNAFSAARNTITKNQPLCWVAAENLCDSKPIAAITPTAASMYIQNIHIDSRSSDDVSKISKVTRFIVLCFSLGYVVVLSVIVWRRWPRAHK